ncbi:GNAT family N-acetyltransferase [Fulvivirga ligni]|uniref:GNAT family N-acetyltransferase n=1 Tax=Fulvivirga ligni TaxID=2904246 RepID=UPI001F29E3B0|nr:GNAT family N-acetyltransferase [Fulvivirga ligni]UII23452.1 GNAT family N-acetyltransferase [Fulvivirga ligni]
MNYSDNIFFEKAEIEDVKLLLNLAIKTFRDTYSDKNTKEDMEIYVASEFTPEKILSELENEDIEYHFAKIDDEIVGYLKVNFGDCQTEKDHPNTVELARVYVVKDYQGRKIGNSLIAKAMDIGRQRNAKYLWLGVWEENQKAIRFYERNGFTIFGKHSFLLGEDLQEDWLMKYDLQG